MSGKLDDGLNPSVIAIYYDPPFTHDTYVQNLPRTSYDNGELLAYVLPSGWTLDDSSIRTMESSRWVTNGSDFDITFSLDDLVQGHGGVYTVWLIVRNEAGESIPVSNISLID
jgi:hypothetical protein